MFDSFKRFFKKDKQHPPFDALKSFVHKDKYFYRIASWYLHAPNEITVVDPNAARVITMDPWPQLVFLEATGKVTVAEFINYLASKYTSTIPEKLDVTVIETLERLITMQLIAYSDSEVKLDASIENPVR